MRPLAVQCVGSPAGVSTVSAPRLDSTTRLSKVRRIKVSIEELPSKCVGNDGPTIFQQAKLFVTFEERKGTNNYKKAGQLSPCNDVIDSLKYVDIRLKKLRRR